MVYTFKMVNRPRYFPGEGEETQAALSKRPFHGSPTYSGLYYQYRRFHVQFMQSDGTAYR